MGSRRFDRPRLRIAAALVVIALVAVLLPAVTPLSWPGAPESASAADSVVTISGTGTPGFQDGPINQARFSSSATGVAASPDTSLIIVADTGNNRVRLINRRTGLVSTIAQVAAPRDVVLGGDGALYVAVGDTSVSNPPGQGEDGPDQILRMTLDGSFTVHATGFYQPSGIAFTSDGTMYVADNHPGDYPARLNKVVGTERETVVDRFGGVWEGSRGLTSAKDLLYIGTGHVEYRVDPSPAPGPAVNQVNISDFSAADLSGDRIFVPNGNRIDTYDTSQQPPGSLEPGMFVGHGAVGLTAATSGDVVFTTAFGDVKVWQRGTGFTGGPILDSEVAGCSWLAPAVNDVHGKAGHPVDTKSGNFHEPFTDFAIPGRGGGLGLSRSYNSMFAAEDGPFGYGWASDITTHLEVDGSGNVTVVQPAGCRQTFTKTGSTYNAAPRVVATLTKHDPSSTYRLVDQGGSLWSFDAATGRLLRTEDPNGYHTDYSYVGGKLSSISDTHGRTLAVSWTGNRITSVTDQAVPTPRTVTYGYDGNGDLRDVTDVGGATWQFGYVGHRLTTMRDPRQAGQAVPKLFVNTYDAQGRVIVQTDQLGRQTLFDYTTFPDATIVTDPKGNKTLETYRDGARTSITRGFDSPTPSTWSFTYDKDTARIRSIVDPNQRVSYAATYDFAGNPLTITDALGRVTTFTYDTAINKPLTVTDPAGVTTRFAYDARRNLTSQCAPLGTAPPPGQTISCLTAGVSKAETFFHYDDPNFLGDLTSITDPKGKVWTYGYDSFGLRDEVETPTGERTTYTFDSVGRPVSMVAPKGNAGIPSDYITSYETNAYGDVTKVIDPLGQDSVRHYDALRQVDVETDANDHTTAYLYDDANQLLQVNRANSTTLGNEYWPDGSLKAQIDGAGARTEYVYDSQGRLTSITDPNARTTSYGYDPAGNLRTRQDPGGDCATNSGCTTYGYDQANQLLTVNYSDPNTPDIAGTSYDKVGRRTSRTLSDFRIFGWQWDTLGRLTRNTDPDGTYVGYEWSLRDELERIRYPNGQWVTRTYDDSGRFTAVTDWDGNTTTFGYDDNSNNDSITFPSGTGNVDTFGFDQADRMSGASAKKGSTTVWGESYTRTNTGQLASVTAVGGPTLPYGYDSIDRLTSWAGFLTYEYDDSDNLTKLLDHTRLVPDPASQLCYSAPGAPSTATCEDPPVGATDYDYDDRGNRIKVTPPAGRPSTMTYDQENRLKTVDQGAEGEFNSIAAYTVLNTANATGTCTPSPCAPVSGGATVTAKVTGGWGGIPDGGVRAVLINVTVSGSPAAGWLAVYPADQAAWPGTSNVNFAAGETVSNSVVAKVSPDGKVKIRNGSANSVQVRIEVTGWFQEASAEGGTTFEPVTPARLMWTAQGGSICNPNPCARMNGNTSMSVDVTGTGPVPANGVSAVAVNVTAINTAAVGSMTVYKNGAAAPAQPNLYWKQGETHAGMVIVPVDDQGRIRLQNNSAGATDVIIDVQGFFLASPDSTPNVLKSLNPARVLATYANVGVCTPNCTRMVGGSTKTVQISGQGGVPATGATAVSVTITAINPAAAGWLEAAPDGSFVQGAASVLNFDPGENVANSAILKLPANGMVVLYTPVATDVIIDVNGYFAAPQSSWTYGYDGDGLRRTRTWEGIAATYRYSLAEGLPQPLSESVLWFNRYFIYGPNGLPVEQIDYDGTKVWFHHDQLGSTRLLTDAAGNWRTKYNYDPYGNPTIDTNPDHPTITTPLAYTGQFTDAETGYQYLRARYYDPTTGRFLTRDPAVTVTRQPYAYGSNSPTNHVDLTGQASVDIPGTNSCFRIPFTSDDGCEGADGPSGIDCINNPWSPDDGCESLGEEHPQVTSGLQVVAGTAATIGCVGVTFGSCAAVVFGVGAAGAVADADRACTVGDAVRASVADLALVWFGLIFGGTVASASSSLPARLGAAGVDGVVAGPDIKTFVDPDKCTC